MNNRNFAKEYAEISGALVVSGAAKGALQYAFTAKLTTFLYHETLRQANYDVIASTAKAVGEMMMAGGRHYHNALHVLSGLYSEDEASSTQKLAYWFHDVIYSGVRGADETNSGTLMVAMLDGVIPDQMLDEAKAMIESTSQYDVPIGEIPRGHRLVLDMDLASFSWPAIPSLVASSNVRKEMENRGIYTIDGDIGFCESMLARGRIFRTDKWHEQHGEQAIRNIELRLKLLQEEQKND